MSSLPAARCPKCDGQPALQAKVLGSTEALECLGCRGLWIDRESFVRVQESGAVRAAILDEVPSLPGTVPETVRYWPCPRCDSTMNRVNFGQLSGVILDHCHAHGMWFDDNELRQIIAFIDAGGVVRAREREKFREELARARERDRQREEQLAQKNDEDSTAWDGFDVFGTIVELFLG